MSPLASRMWLTFYKPRVHSLAFLKTGLFDAVSFCKMAGQELGGTYYFLHIETATSMCGTMFLRIEPRSPTGQLAHSGPQFQ